MPASIKGIPAEALYSINAILADMVEWLSYIIEFVSIRSANVLFESDINGEGLFT